MSRFKHVTIAAALTAALAGPGLAQDGDPAAGEKVFRKCAACHAAKEGGASRVGPNLYGVVGRTTGTVEDFRYSGVMTEAGENGHVWTVEELDIYLQNPKTLMPGTTMAFVGLKNPKERADVIAYLVSVSPDAPAN